MCLNSAWYCLLSFRLLDTRSTAKQLKLLNSIKVQEGRGSFELMLTEKPTKTLKPPFNYLVKECLDL